MDTKALDCIVTSNSGANNDGIIAASRALISGCTASANGGDGINVGARCAVLNNLVTENAGDGIEVTGPYNRIEGNNAVGNALIGVKANSAGTSTGNLILRNSAGSNDTANYSVIAGNLTGGAPVTSANSASNTNPHANYSLE